MKFSSTFIGLLCFITQVEAQVLTSVDIISSYGDNLNQSTQAKSDFSNRINLEVGFQHQTQPLYLYLSGDINTFNKNSQYNFSSYNVGFDYGRGFGTNGIHDFYVGGQAGLRSNNTLFDVNDHQQFELQSDLQFNFNQITIRTGYRYRLRNYRNITHFSNNLHSAYIQFNKSFQTGTSVIIESDFGLKLFSDDQNSTRRTGTQRFNKPLSNIATENRNYSHFGLVARIAQSLHPRAGLFLEYSGQFSLQKSSNLYLNSYLLEDELFDDPFSYDYNKLRSQLKILFPKSFELTIGGSLNRKNYSNETVQSVFSTVRIDEQKQIIFTLSRNFNFGKKAKILTLNMNFNYLNNSSNYEWYDYSGSALSVGFNWRL